MINGSSEQLTMAGRDRAVRDQCATSIISKYTKDNTEVKGEEYTGMSRVPGRPLLGQQKSMTSLQVKVVMVGNERGMLTEREVSLGSCWWSTFASLSLCWLSTFVSLSSCWLVLISASTGYC